MFVNTIIAIVTYTKGLVNNTRLHHSVDRWRLQKPGRLGRGKNNQKAPQHQTSRFDTGTITPRTPPGKLIFQREVNLCTY